MAVVRRWSQVGAIEDVNGKHHRIVFAFSNIRILSTEGVVIVFRWMMMVVIDVDWLVLGCVGGCC